MLKFFVNEISENNAAIIPKPVYPVIDDVGWWSGTNGSEYGQPYRTGIKRRHCVNDYEALDLFARKSGIKPQVALVLGEWDRRNILKSVPNSNWELEDWDNSHNIGAHLHDAMDVINRGNLCVAVHGLCHEYWHEKGVFTRAEFSGGRDAGVMGAHLDAYMSILHDNGFSGQINAYVPPAFSHRVNTVTKLLTELGIKYMSTIFKTMECDTKADRYIIENGIINCDRVNNVISWDWINPTPPDEVYSGFFGLHWPNLLHPDPDRNVEAVDKWVEYFSRCNNVYGIVLAKNEDEAHLQTVYEKDTLLDVSDEGVSITVPKDVKTETGCYLQTGRELQLAPAAKKDGFFEYIISMDKDKHIKWR